MKYIITFLIEENENQNNIIKSFEVIKEDFERMLFLFEKSKKF